MHPVHPRLGLSRERGCYNHHVEMRHVANILSNLLSGPILKGLGHEIESLRRAGRIKKGVVVLKTLLWVMIVIGTGK